MKLMNLARLAMAACSLVPGMACTYSATAATVGNRGGNVAVRVYTQPGCVWQAQVGPFGSIYSGQQGSGNGIVMVSVAPSTDKIRTIWIKGFATVVTNNPIPGPKPKVPPRTPPAYTASATTVLVFQSTISQYGR